MPIHLHPLSNEIGVITHSQARFQAIAEALKEPCVWLNQHNADGAEHSYEVVIIDHHNNPGAIQFGAGSRAPAWDATPESAVQPEGSAIRRQPGLVIFQCPDGAD